MESRYEQSRRTFRLTAFHSIALFCLVFVCGVSPAQEKPQAQSKHPKPSIEQYQRVTRLRETLCLTSSDLAALGCTREQSEAIFQKLLGWHEVNRQELGRVERAIAASKRDLQLTDRRKTMESDMDSFQSDLEPRRQQIVAAENAKGSLLDQLALSVSSDFSPSQRADWRRALRGHRAGVPKRQRYAVSASESQIAAGAGEILRRRQKMTTRDAVRIAWRRAVRPEVAQVNHQKQRVHAKGVASAEAQVLPIPAELNERFESLAAPVEEPFRLR